MANCDLLVAGLRLRAARKQRNLSRPALEKITTVSAKTIERYENGDIKSMETLCKLCDGLGITLAQLFVDENDCIDVVTRLARQSLSDY